MEMKFYRCETCGQIVAIVKKSACPIMCCGKPMKEIVPNSTDGAYEKHVPVLERDGGKVIVRNIDDNIRGIFMMTGFLNLFEIQ